MSAPYPDPYAAPPRRGLPPWVWVLIALGGLGMLCGPIAILAAILFPVFSQARNKARAASCLQNVKQLSIALNKYEQDYGERAPWAANWADAIYPYHRNYAIYVCPTMGTVPINAAGPGTSSYTYNLEQS